MAARANLSRELCRETDKPMQMKSKEVAKEDGRYLVFYHFPESASAEQTDAFERSEAYAKEAVDAARSAASAAKAPADPGPGTKS
jgi:hypothetical protein